MMSKWSIFFCLWDKQVTSIINKQFIRPRLDLQAHNENKMHLPSKINKSIQLDPSYCVCAQFGSRAKHFFLQRISTSSPLVTCQKPEVDILHLAVKENNMQLLIY